MIDAERRPRSGLVLLAVATGLFMALLDATVVNIAIPTIMDDFDAGVTTVSWVINSYNLALAVLFLITGRFAERFGQRRVFVCGLVIFAAFSLACALAPSIGWLIAFRALQGVGAAAMLPVSLSILLAVFPREKHGAAIGAWGGIGVVAAALGPTIGGALTEYTSWSWIFYINLPIAVVALLLTYRFVPTLPGTQGRRGMDMPGIVLSAAGFFALTLALIQGNEWGWQSGRIVGLFAAAGVLVAAWVVRESRISDPMLDVRLFRRRGFAAANLATLLVSVTMMGAMFTVVLYMVRVLGYSEIRAAVAITPMPLTGALTAPFAGRLVDRVQPRWMAAIGAILFAAGLTLFVLLPSDASWGDIAWRAVIVGMGSGLAIPSLATSAMRYGSQTSPVQSSATVNWSRQMGFVIGVAVLTAVLTGSMQSHLTSAVDESRAYVAQNPDIPVAAKLVINAKLTELGEKIESGAVGGQASSLAAAGLSSTTTAQLSAQQAAIMEDVTTHVRGQIEQEAEAAFDEPFAVAAAFSLAALVPALLIRGPVGALGGAGAATSAPAEPPAGSPGGPLPGSGDGSPAGPRRRRAVAGVDDRGHIGETE